jgi:D-glycero-alpha-D-manno-heptose 1-phosphate guanylyltransferase
MTDLFFFMSSIICEARELRKFIFSLGYKHEVVEAYLQTDFPTLDFQCLVEKEPLGTGGAILASCYKTSEQTVLVVNGDTFLKLMLKRLLQIIVNMILTAHCC